MFQVDYKPEIERLRLAIQRCGRKQIAAKVSLIQQLNRVESLAEAQGDDVDRSFRIV